MTLRDRQPLRIHVPRREIRKPLLPEHARRLAEQPAELRDRHRLCLMQLEILLDELGERDRGRTATGAEALQSLVKRQLRLSPCREPTDLWPRGAAALETKPIRPQRLAVRVSALQLEHLTLLDHLNLLDR